MNDGALPLPLRVLRRAAGYLFLILLSGVSLVSRRPIMVIVVPFGNLGNRLFLYANVLAFAMDKGAIVLNPAFHPWREVFAGTRPGGVAAYPPPPLPHFPGGLIEAMVQQLSWVGASIASSCSPRSKGRSGGRGKWVSISIEGNERIDFDHPGFAAWAKGKHVIFLSGWLFVSPISTPRQSDKISRYFRQILGVESSVKAQLSELRDSCDVVVGVLIRHGDYRHWMGGKYFYPTEQYVRWIRDVVALFPDQRVGFFITGNDDQHPEGIQDLPHQFRSHSDLASRYLLSCCDYILSPPGTYAGWAAFAGSVPLLILSSADVAIRREGFQRICNHLDMRDPSFPPDDDLTEALITPFLP